MSQLHHYLARLHDTIRSRQEIIVELLEIDALLYPEN